MSDASTRELLRHAETQADPLAWERLGAAFTREGRFREAGRALVFARALGGMPHAVEDALEPARVTAFRLGSRRTARLRAIRFDLAAAALYGIGDDGRVHHVPEGSDEGRPVSEGRPGAFAVDPRAELLALLELRREKFSVAIVSLATGRVKDRLPLEWLSWQHVVWSGLDAILVWGNLAQRHAVSRAGKIERAASWALNSSNDRIGDVDGRAIVDRIAGAVWVREPRLQYIGDGELPRKNRNWVFWAKYATTWPSHRSIERFVANEDLFRAALAKRDIRALAASPTGRYVAAQVGYPDVLVLLDLEARMAVDHPTDGAAYELVWSPCGRRLALATSKGTFFLEGGGA